MWLLGRVLSRVISFIKNNSEILNLPKNKIILAGVSAGAGIAQWNGLKKSSNDQVKGILTLAAQSTYDLYQWEKIFKDFFSFIEIFLILSE